MSGPWPKMQSTTPQSPEELYSKLTRIEPTVEEIVELVDKEESIYNMKSKADFDSLPEFNWYGVFPRKETKSKKPRSGNTPQGRRRPWSRRRGGRWWTATPRANLRAIAPSPILPAIDLPAASGV